MPSDRSKLKKSLEEHLLARQYLLQYLRRCKIIFNIKEIQILFRLLSKASAFHHKMKNNHLIKEFIIHHKNDFYMKTMKYGNECLVFEFDCTLAINFLIA